MQVIHNLCKCLSELLPETAMFHLQKKCSGTSVVQTEHLHYVMCVQFIALISMLPLSVMATLVKSNEILYKVPKQSMLTMFTVSACTVYHQLASADMRLYRNYLRFNC